MEQNKMQVQFGTEREIKTIVHDPAPLDVFVNTVNEMRPTEIFNPGWSQSMPFIVITEYTTNGLMWYCNGAADKEPQPGTAENIYYHLRYGGLATCYFYCDDSNIELKYKLDKQ